MKFAICNRPIPPRSLRPSFTLVELLVAILIISILAAALLGVAAVAGETARDAKTRNIIARLHTLLMEQYDTYKSRRVKLRETVGAVLGIEDQINLRFPAATSAVPNRVARSEARLYALREMMLMEMPDRWSDVVLGDPSAFVNPSGAFPVPFYLPARTELSNLYLRQYRTLLSRIGSPNPVTGQFITIGDIAKNQSAECLYLIIMNATGDGEAKSLFAESTIGDTDGDGAPEFLDGWGHPISFLRWAPGFNSDVQLSDARLTEIRDEAVADGKDGNAAVASAIAKDHDPFDLFRVEQKAIRLVPLIYSAGRDESAGLYDAAAVFTWRISPSQLLTFSPSQPFIQSPRLTPYEVSPVTPFSDYLGTIDPTDTKSATDNIHNHLIGTR